MTDSKTRFHFKFAEVEIEIDGDKDFVDRMYQKVLADVERARTFDNLPITRTPSEVIENEDESISKKIIWVHKTSEMMNKIYMSTLGELDFVDLLGCTDLRGVAVIYCDKRSIDYILPDREEGQTLWAELTTRGKEQIASSGSIPIVED